MDDIESLNVEINEFDEANDLENEVNESQFEPLTIEDINGEQNDDSDLSISEQIESLKRLRETLVDDGDSEEQKILSLY